MNRKAFKLAIHELLEVQKTMKRPLVKAKAARMLAREIVKRASLQGDPRERYFKLLATCALMGKESMYSSFKRRRRKNARR